MNIWRRTKEASSPKADIQLSMKAIQILKKQFDGGVLSHAVLFSGINLEEKEKAVEFISSKLLGENFPSHPDFYEIGLPAETGGEKISIEEAVALRSRAGVTALGLNKIFLIRQIENMTFEAAPAFLKMLEEPAPHTIFIATTTNLNKISPIIKSRFSHFRFPAGEGIPAGKPSLILENILKLPYQKRFLEVPKFLETNGLPALIKETILKEMRNFRKNFQNPDKISRLLKIQNAASDPTVNKKLLGEYLMMNI